MSPKKGMSLEYNSQKQKYIIRAWVFAMWMSCSRDGITLSKLENMQPADVL